MQVKEEEIIALLGAIKSGNKGWKVCSYPCPYCKTPHHLSIIFGEKISSFKCVKCSKHGSMFILLSEIKRLDLLISNKVYDKEVKLERKLNIEKLEIEPTDEILPIMPPPLGFKRVYSDEYLEGRGFTKEQFEIFEVGTARLDPKLKNDYVIFMVKDLSGNNIAYLARSRKTKEQIKVINEKYKNRGSKSRYLRWCNSSSDFEKILFGFNEITEETKTIILVEGPTSKFNVDRLLDLYTDKKVKCCATFGKKISIYQINKMYKAGIEQVILLHDPDAIEESKNYAIELEKYFNTLVGYIPEGKDPGDLNENELAEVLTNLEEPLEFKKNKLAKKTLL